MKQLTKQQKTFVIEYIRTLDGELSAKKAGYKTKDLKTFSQELLKKSSIINEIKNQLKLTIDSLNVPKGYVIQKLLQITEFSLEEEDILDKEGNPTGKKKLRDASAGLKSIESMCKYLSNNNSQNDCSETKIITIANLDDEKI